jgi:hypothetical protein
MTASWIIVVKSTGTPLLETFDRQQVEAINTERYEAVPLMEYLQQARMVGGGE